MDISELISPTVNRAELARVLDDVGEQVRTNSVLELDRRELAALFEAAADNEPYTLWDLVPSGVPAMTEVIHDGKNSLPLFSRFQKRFCRPGSGGGAGPGGSGGEAEPMGSGGGAEELWGYNEQAMRACTGPGYFVARAEGPGVVIDYTRVPGAKPDGWPEIIPNSARLGRFIYDGTQDVVRRVSRHVCVGRAARGDKPMDAWFVLVRRDDAGQRRG